MLHEKVNFIALSEHEVKHPLLSTFYILRKIWKTLVVQMKRGGDDET